jgi:hypothetical protein
MAQTIPTPNETVQRTMRQKDFYIYLGTPVVGAARAGRNAVLRAARAVGARYRDRQPRKAAILSSRSGLSTTSGRPEAITSPSAIKAILSATPTISSGV